MPMQKAHVWVIALVLIMVVTSYSQTGFRPTLAISYQQLPVRSIYYRPFDLGGRQHAEPDSVLVAEMAKIQPTMITHIVHNEDPSNYTSLISSLQALASHPAICFGLGNKAWSFSNAGDYANMISIAQTYKKYTNCLNVNPFDKMESNSNEADARRFLTDLHNMGFQHLIANSWITPPSGRPWAYVDAMEQSFSSPKQQGNSWFVAPLWACCNTNPEERSKTILDYQAQAPGVTIIANYENPPGERALTQDGAQGSIQDMSIGANGQQAAKPVTYRWMPPWSSNYDPYTLGTLNWIKDTLATIGPTSQQSTVSTSIASSSGFTASIISSSSGLTTSTATTGTTSTTSSGLTTSVTSSSSSSQVTTTNRFSSYVATSTVSSAAATSSLATSSVSTPMTLPPIPGFPWESIIVGVILGMAALAIIRRRRR